MAQARDLPEWMLSELARVGIPAEAVSVYAKDAGTGAVLISHNATIPFKPASIMKVLTTYASLEVLGEAYQWRTPVYYSGQIARGELRGNLIFRGVGDPSLSHDKLRAFAARLLRRGVRAIQGDVILDSSFFPFNTEIPSQFHREQHNPWNLPPHPLLINGKTVSVIVAGDRLAHAARVRIDPPLRSLRVHNATALDGHNGCRNPKESLDFQIDGAAHAATVRVGGTLSVGCDAVVKNVSVLDAQSFFEDSFRAVYEGQGGRILGKFKAGIPIDDAHLLGNIASDKLTEILRITNKNSNNLMARLLFLAVGAELTGRAPTPALAAQAIQKWISAKVPETRHFVLENGSGLSDQERVTTLGMVALLDHIRRSPHAAEFFDTLPSVGQDGTMRKRLRDPRVAGRSAAKTGTLRDTSALAGMLLNIRGRPILYTIVVNHAQAKASVNITNRLVQWLNELPPDSPS